MGNELPTYVILAYEDRREYSIYRVSDEIAVKSDIEKKQAAGGKISLSFYKRPKRADVDVIARGMYPSYRITGIRGKTQEFH